MASPMVPGVHRRRKNPLGCLSRGDREGFIKRANDQHMAQHLNANVASFNGVKASEVLFLYNTIAEEVVDLPGHYHALIEQAEQALERHISAYILSP